MLVPHLITTDTYLKEPFCNRQDSEIGRLKVNADPILFGLVFVVEFLIQIFIVNFENTKKKCLGGWLYVLMIFPNYKQNC